MASRRFRINRRGSGFAAIGGGDPVVVPLAGTWDGGFWDLSHVSQADDSELLSWSPLEGAVTLTASAGTTAPRYRTSTFPGGRDVPSVQFTAASLQKMGGHALAAMLNSAGAGAPFSIFAMCVPTFPSAAQYTLMSAGRGASTDYLTMHLTSSGVPAAHRQSGGLITATQSQPDQDGIQMISMVFDGSQCTLHRDGFTNGADAMSSASPLNSLTEFWIGAFVRDTITSGLDGRLLGLGLRSAAFDSSARTSIYEHFRGTPLQIWPIGDSITLGSDAVGFTLSWRAQLWQRIAQRNYRADLVGHLDNGTTWSHTKHSGQSGVSIAGALSNYNTHKGSFDPALIIWSVGTNNMGAGSTAFSDPGTMNEYADSLATIQTDFPDVPIAVTTICPIDPAQPLNGGGSPGQPDLNRQTFNAALPAIWDAHEAAFPSSPALIRADDEAELGGAWSAGDFGDAFHPNDTGHTKIAAGRIAAYEAWFQANAT